MPACDNCWKCGYPSSTAAGDDLSHAYAALGPHYSEAEILQLVFTVIAINSWNRLNIACASPAGSYKPGDHEARLLGALRRLTGREINSPWHGHDRQGRC